MRLIDLDEIEYFTLVDKDGIPRYRIEIGDGLPIVKAIPIEFIKAFKKEFRAVASVKEVIDWLLEKWEKENGAE